MTRKEFKEQVKSEVRDTLEFKSKDISGRLLTYLTAKHFVLNLPQDHKEVFLEILDDLFKETDILSNYYSSSVDSGNA